MTDMITDIKTGEVFRVLLNSKSHPTIGSEQSGYRYCAIVSPASINNNLKTCIIVPLTTSLKHWPTRVETNFNGISGQAMCEQIITVDKARLIKSEGSLSIFEVEKIKYVLRSMFEG